MTILTWKCFPYLQTALGIGLLIFVHELGHYICARLAGVRVFTFSLGFGPRLLGLQRGGTDYRLSLVPLGGYVRVAGEDPAERENLRPDDLHAKGFLARALFFSGGVAMNLLFAFVAFPIVFHHGIDFTAPVVGGVAVGGPAWSEGLQPGDRILAVDDKEMYSFENMQVEIALASGDEVSLTVQRGEQVLHKTVRPTYSDATGMRSIDIAPPADPEPPAVTVDPGSPAAQAGLCDGDRLLTMEGHPFASAEAEELLTSLAYSEPHPITLRVQRQGAVQEVTFTPQSVVGRPRIGVLRASRRVVAVRSGLQALDLLGLRAGDHVVAIDGKPFAGDLQEALPRASGELAMTVQRDGRPLEVHAHFSTTDLRALAEYLVLGVDREDVVVRPQPASPAAKAGVQYGDAIVRVDGAAVAAWADLQKAVAKSAGKPTTFTLRRAGHEVQVTIDPSTQELRLGFVPHAKLLQQRYQVQGLWPSIKAGMVASGDLIKQLYVTLKKLFTGDVAAKNLGGIITISRVSYEVAQAGWARFLYFLGLLSINLAFINVLPIPVLDGGHLLFLLIERIKGSPVSPKVLTYSQVVGLVFVVALMVWVTINDIQKLF